MKFKIKELIKERDDYKCRLCGDSRKLQIHHIKPKADGGKTTLDNCIILCFFCHFQIHKNGGDNKWSE